MALRQTAAGALALAMDLKSRYKKSPDPRAAALEAGRGVGIDLYRMVAFESGRYGVGRGRWRVLWKATDRAIRWNDQKSELGRKRPFDTSQRNALRI